MDKKSLNLSDQEIDYLVKLVQSVGNQHNLSQSVLQKIQGLTVANVGAENIFSFPDLICR